MTAGVTPDDFGELPDGRHITRFTLRNRHGLTVQVIEYGATITSVCVPDRHGTLDDVVLGFDTLAGYLAPHPHIGCTVGRVAGRIAHARFPLDGTSHHLPANQPPHHLHGGEHGLHRVPWTGAVCASTGDSVGVELRCTSPDGDEGYPGRLAVRLRLTLSDEGVLALDYEATTDRATPVSLTNHAYWNLAGRGTTGRHDLIVRASRQVELDDRLLATGVLAPLEGTPLDLRQPRRINDLLAALPGGLDHALVLDPPATPTEPAARLRDPVSGRTLALHTDEPVLVLYSGNALDGTLVGTGGVPLHRHAGLCLEPQRYPDAVNRPEFPSTIVRPDTPYRQHTTLAFGVEAT